MDKARRSSAPLPERENLSDLLSSEEAAAYLGVQPGTMEVWRSTRRQVIPYFKVGRLVKYRKAALDAWLASRAVDSQAA